MASDSQLEPQDSAQRPSLKERVSAKVQPGSALLFLVAVIAVLILGVIMGVAVHLAMPNGKDSNDPNKLPDRSSQVLLLPTYRH